jgi:hypothetical protein
MSGRAGGFTLRCPEAVGYIAVVRGQQLWAYQSAKHPNLAAISAAHINAFLCLVRAFVRNVRRFGSLITYAKLVGITKIDRS